MKSIAIISAISLISVSAIAMQPARADMYKTDKKVVVITGLTPKSSHTIQTTNAKGKNKTRKPVMANSCGELLVTNATIYPSIIVDGKPIAPSGLPIKVHNRCKAKAMTKKLANPATSTLPN